MITRATSTFGGSLKKAGRFFSRTLAALCVLAVPIAGLAGSGAGCVKSGDAPPPPAQTGTSASSGTASASASVPISLSDAGIAVAGPVYSVSLISNTSECQPGKTSVGPSPLRRISRVEYDDMVRDLLNDQTQPALQFVAESPMATGVNFDTNTYTTVQDTIIPQEYLEAAETLAATAVGAGPMTATDAGDDVGASSALSNLVGCSGAQQNDTCAQQFIDSFANRAFRGQYDSTESQSLFGIYSTVKGTFDFATGIQAVIVAVLTSPRFLFVLEFGQPGVAGNAVLLTPNELATRLSLFLWRSIPDATLLSDAQSGTLSTASGMQAEVQRMLQDGKAKAALEDFATQWMELQNTPSVTKDTQFTKWTSLLAQELQTETLETFYNEVATENSQTGATLTELLTSADSYINTDLASFYGVGGGDNSWATKTNVNPSGLTIRAGLLTQGSVMATQAHTSLPSPVLRGKLVREQVLCDVVPDPPAAIDGVPISPPPATIPPGQTTNEQYVQHLNNSACSGCHTMMDPIGFGFANFDATGAYQANDSNGQPDAGSYPPIDAGGSVAQGGAGQLSIPSFYGPVALATQLASAPEVQECYTLQQFRYALGRLESLADACSLQQAFQSFSASSSPGPFSLQQALVAIAQSDSFRYRNAETAGSECQ